MAKEGILKDNNTGEIIYPMTKKECVIGLSEPFVFDITNVFTSDNGREGTITQEVFDGLKNAILSGNIITIRFSEESEEGKSLINHVCYSYTYGEGKNTTDTDVVMGLGIGTSETINIYKNLKAVREIYNS